MTRSRLLLVASALAPLLSATACAGDGSTARPTPNAVGAGAASTTANLDVAATKAGLPERTIEVRGEPLVGQPLTAVISPDLKGRIQSWGWHRCTKVPICQTITSADASIYTPTRDDAWQILRVIAVADRDDGPAGGITFVIGPIVNAEPERFHHAVTIDPSMTTGIQMIVAPEPVRVRVEASCDVEIIARINTARPDGPEVTAEHTGAPSSSHDFTLDSDGGELVLLVVGDCNNAGLKVDASR